MLECWVAAAGGVHRSHTSALLCWAEVSLEEILLCFVFVVEFDDLDVCLTSTCYGWWWPCDLCGDINLQDLPFISSVNKHHSHMTYVNINYLVPSLVPSLISSLVPSLIPSLIPLLLPLLLPSLVPSLIPSLIPSLVPSLVPLLVPSMIPCPSAQTFISDYFSKTYRALSPHSSSWMKWLISMISTVCCSSKIFLKQILVYLS